MNAFGVQSQLSEAENARLMDSLQEMQIRDAQRMYNDTVQRCFMRCVDSFRGQILEPGEARCLDVCCDKSVKALQRVGARFAEQNMQQQQPGPGAA